MFAKFLKDESGATAIEYTLLAALIGIVIIGGAELVGTAIDGKLTTVASEVTSAGS